MPGLRLPRWFRCGFRWLRLGKKRVNPCKSGGFVVNCALKTMDSKKLAELCREYADNKKAEKVAVLDVRKVSSVADYYVIASGSSEPHVRAIMEEITDKLREDHDIRARAVDGTRQGSWIVLDYFDVIVHVMRQDAREHYDLEGLWSDAARVKVTKAKAIKASNAKPRVKKVKPKAS